MRTFTVNGKEYKAKAFDFNMVCDLEDMGIPLAEMGKKPTILTRAYLAICSGKGKEYAGKELEEHFIKGGNLEELAEALNKEMEESDFFRALNKTAEAENGESKSKTK